MKNPMSIMLTAAASLALAGCFSTGNAIGDLMVHTAARTATQTATQAAVESAMSGDSEGGEGQSFESAAGRSYSGAAAKAGLSLEEIEALPSEIAPMSVALEATGAKYLNGRPRIAVPSYGLSFVRAAEASASALGRGSSLAQRSITYETALVGVSDEDLRALTDEAHADFLTRLAEAGFDVVPMAEIAATEGYREASRIEGNKLQDSGVISQRGEDTWTTFGASDAPLIKGMALETGFARVAAAGNQGDLQNAGVELDAVMVQPVLMMHYIGLDSSGQSAFTSRANLSATTAFWLHPMSRVDFGYKAKKMGGTGYGGAFTLSDRVYSSEPFAVLREVEDNSDDAGLHNAFASLGMGSMFRQSKVLAAVAAPERYKALVRAAYQGFNQSIVDEMRRARSGA